MIFLTRFFVVCFAMAFAASIAVAQTNVNSAGIAGKPIVKERPAGNVLNGLSNNEVQKTQLINMNGNGSGHVQSFIIPSNKAAKSATIFYCYVAVASAGLPLGPASSTTTNPTVVNSIADQTALNYLTAGTWITDKWYGIESTSNLLVTIDTLTGVRTTIGNPGQAITGLAYDYSNSILYGIGYNGTNSSLYTINSTTGAATLVGVCTTDILINLACSKTGVLYSVSINTDNIYTVNPATGALTLVGAIGFDASYAQDMEFDHNDETLYMAAYNVTSGAGELRSVNLGTGAATLIGAFQGNSEITGFAIPNVPNYFTDDAKPVALIAPTSADSLSGADSVKVTVKNAGSNPITTGLSVSFSLDGSAAVTEAITGTLAAGASVLHTFATTVDLSNPGAIFNFEIYTSYAADSNIANDTIYASVTNQWDVAPITIDEPPVIGPGSINPKASVENNSTMTTSFTVTMEIQGGYTSTQNVTNLAAGGTQQVIFDPWNPANGTYAITVYTTLAADSIPTNDTIHGSIQVSDLTKFYCYNAYDPTSVIPGGPAYSYLQTPETVTSLADQSAMQFIGAGTWGYGNTWFGAVYGDNTLVKLDTITGARTVIGNIGFSLSGMSFDYSTNTMFGVDWDGVNSNLYKINILNGAPTYIGTCTSELLINLACDSSGLLYAVSITDDNLYSINKTTGVATIIGAIGFDASYAQDMEFDLYHNVLYMAAYNAGTAGELRIVNTTTGSTTLIGAFQNGIEVTGMAIPYITALPAIDAGAVSINGLKSSCSLGSAEPVELTVKNMGTTNITTFDATFVVDGGTPVTETVTHTILPGATYNYVFTATANLSAPGEHTIVAYVDLAGDILFWNDTTSVTVSQIEVSDVPYSMGFEPSDDVSGWKIEDVNGDGITWYYAAAGGNTSPGCTEYSWSAPNAANDWLISTCLQFNSGTDYKLTFYYKAMASYPESMMVHIGSDNVPTALTTLLDDMPSITVTTYTLREVNFTVPSSGVYYLGWHCYSAADQYNLFLDDINISEVSGLDKTSDKTAVSVYPNPVNDMLNIASGSVVSNIRITNMVGAVVYNSAVNGKQFRINTANFVQGMYFISLETEEGRITQKFVVE